jgi:C-terminal processing protease CtpA/Prc
MLTEKAPGQDELIWLILAFFIIALFAFAWGLASFISWLLKHRVGALSVAREPINWKQAAFLFAVTLGLTAQSFKIEGVSSYRNSNIELALALDREGLPPLSEARFLSQWMRKEYWWSEEIEAPQALWGDPRKLFKAARSPKDKWSYIIPRESEALREQGLAKGYGISVHRQGETLLIADIEPNSPAEQDGVSRGDRILAVNGKTPTKEAWNEAVPRVSADGVELQLESPDGQVLRYAKTSGTPYRRDAISDYTLLQDRPGRRIAYFQLRHFDSNSASEFLRLSQEHLSKDKPDELIIDLRNNGGGSMGQMIWIGSRLSDSRRDNRLPFKSHARSFMKDARGEHSYALINLGRSGRIDLKRVLFLTGPDTCSAAELLITALRPHIEVVTLGERTCGKSYGSTPVTYGRYSYGLISLSVTDDTGNLLYPDGIEPTCKVGDDFRHAYGDPGDPLIQAALGYVESGRCPAAKSPSS